MGTFHYKLNHTDDDYLMTRSKDIEDINDVLHALRVLNELTNCSCRGCRPMYTDSRGNTFTTEDNDDG